MMKSTSDESALRITCVGAAARGHLTPGQSGEVLAVLSNAIYLLTASHQLLWLASDGAPMHRRCMKVSTSLPRPVAGAPFHVHDHFLKIDPGLVLDTATASLWEPPQVNRNDVVGMSELPGRVRALATSLDLMQARGLGRFIAGIVGCESDWPAPTDDAVLKRATPVILSIAAACLSQDWWRIALGADALLGLGGGLTPSGDDFLGGLLFGTRALRAAYPASNAFDTAIISELDRTRTNPISFTLLDDFANGHAIEPLHDIVNGILIGRSFETIRPAIWQLTQVGHSTGWDMLTGLFAGLLMAQQGDHL